ncbi:MAG: IQ calmodulin-binding motif-containing protein, partial [bacterium]
MEARKQVAEMKAEKEKLNENDQENETKEETSEQPHLEFAVNLDDPEVEKAVTVIQAGYRGMEARKQVAEMKAEKEKLNENDQENETK